MRKCDDCNTEMIDYVKIEGKHPFEFDIDSKTNLYLLLKGKGIFDESHEIKSRVCPCCGKIELYIDLKK